ncbi:MAG: TlpA family protein disulfide reductase [bacterium]|nr:TlpA family protein disulfide reductase [bacterium]
MMKRTVFGALALLALAVGLAGPLRAGWGDEPAPADPAHPVDSQAADKQPAAGPNPEANVETTKSDPVKPVVQDNPGWDKYSFSLPLASGEGNLRFADLARSGRPFVLVWWLSDCPVCNMQMPYVQQLARLGDDKDVGVWVVGINIDTDESECDRYVRNKKLVFDVLRDPRGRRTDSQYGVRDEGTPMTYVFNAGGDYAGKLSGYTKNYPTRVLALLGLKMPETAGSGGVTVDRADGTKQSRGFN